MGSELYHEVLLFLFLLSYDLKIFICEMSRCIFFGIFGILLNFFCSSKIFFSGVFASASVVKELNIFLNYFYFFFQFIYTTFLFDVSFLDLFPSAGRISLLVFLLTKLVFAIFSLRYLSHYIKNSSNQLDTLLDIICYIFYHQGYPRHFIAYSALPSPAEHAYPNFFKIMSV